MDRNVETFSSDMTFEPGPVERLFAKQPASPPAAGRRFLALWVVCLLIHAGVLYVLIRENGFFPLVVTAPQEIPVEIVVEQPPPEPPAPKEQPPSVQNTLKEDAATDAPRTANDEKIERDAPDEESQAPRTAPPSSEQATEPSPDKPATSPGEAASQAQPKSSGGEDEVPAESSTAEHKAAAETKAEPDQSTNTVADLLAGFKPLPDYRLGSAAGPSPVGGGRAKTTYLTILYGLIMPHMVVPERFRSSQAEGEVAFDVDATGRLTFQTILRSSGFRELDAAALAALRQASPFPAPPGGLPLGLTFTFTTR